jgi:superfamily I DNA/RNA helicase
MHAADPVHPLLRNLNPPQQEAVQHGEGPLLILAGAGSGKTTVITRRIAWLIEEAGVRPGSILAMTFTNKAAGEMAERVQKLVSVTADQLWVSTFHSFCTRILRREGDRTPVGRDFVIFDPSDQRSLIKQVLAELKLSEKQFHPKKVLEVISDFKNRCLLPEEAREDFLDPWTRKVLDAYELYQTGLRNSKACDFDDLLLHTERLFRNEAVQAAYAERFKFILVDEYQDTNKAQYLLVQHLARTHHNLCVVGDEDQCLPAGTPIRMADGSERGIETLKPGAMVLSCVGSGVFRPAKVLRVTQRIGRTQGIAITTRSGRRLVSTPEHTHFAGYRVLAPAGPALTLTLCDEPRGAAPMHRLSLDGRGAQARASLEGLGLAVQPLLGDPSAWRFEAVHGDFGVLSATAGQVREALGEVTFVRQAKLGALDPRAQGALCLPFTPASAVRPGMAMFNGEGGYEVVAEVEPATLEGSVFDLDIEGTHNFIAQGLLTHNSIYGWRGADIRNILDFQRDFPEAVQIKLEQNYRSTQKILDAASKVIANNSQRLGKTLWTNLGEGHSLTFKLLDEGRLEAEFVVQKIREERLLYPGSRMAVLYRANWQSRQLEEALRGANVPYKLVGGTKFYERQEVKDLLAYLRLVSNPFDLTSFRRSVNAPTRGVGPTTLAKIEAAIPEGGTPLEGVIALLRRGEIKGRAQRELGRYADLFAKAAQEAPVLGLAGLVRWVLVESGYVQMLEDEATLEAESRLRNLEEFISAAAESEALGLRLPEFLDRVTLASDSDQLEEEAVLSLMTIHCAKGLEFPVVFLVGMEEDVFPNRNARETEDGIEEERRLFYVAITRAQQKLYLTAARRRRMMGQEVLGMPSRFLRELPSEGLETPIRWGTELYQSGQGAQTARHSPSGGVTSVATELHRIRGFFERVKGVAPAEPAEDAPEPSEPVPPPEPPASSGWPRGTRVLSPRFGRGVITAATGSGDGLTYTVRFSEGEKRIVARFGMLERES